MIINTNKNGFFCYCEDCQEYHIQFNNVFLTLTDEKFEKFVGYLKEIDENAPLIEEHEFVSDKNIILPILHPYMVVLINIEELRMLKKLILLDENILDSISYEDFPYKITDN